MALNHLKGFILILIILWLVWFFTGGPSKDNGETPFVEPISDIQNPE
jgi:hypothetical protein